MRFKQSRQYAIELDGETYCFSKNRLDLISGINDIHADMYLVSDMQKAISRTLTIESPTKYTEIMTRKRLQESGEFDEPISVIAHQKKGKGKNLTDTFFTALPTRILYQYYDQVREHQNSVMIFPLYTLLYSILKKMKPAEPLAIVFQHNRFADFIIGTGERVYYANRCVTFDESEEQIAALWDVVRTEIETTKSEHGIEINKVFKLRWLYSKEPPEWPEDIKAPPYISSGTNPVLFNEEQYDLPILRAVEMMPAVGSISPPLEKVFYYANRYAPHFNTALLVGIVVLFAGSLWCCYKNNSLKKDLSLAEMEKSKIELEVSREVPLIPYEKTFSFVKDVASCHNAPSFKEIINDISSALSSGMNVNVLKLDYSKDRVKVEVFGRTETSFDSAHTGYQAFEKNMEGKKYSIDGSKFDTEISSSVFLAEMSRRIQ